MGNEPWLTPTQARRRRRERALWRRIETARRTATAPVFEHTAHPEKKPPTDSARNETNPDLG